VKTVASCLLPVAGKCRADARLSGHWLLATGNRFKEHPRP